MQNAELSYRNSDMPSLVTLVTVHPADISEASVCIHLHFVHKSDTATLAMPCRSVTSGPIVFISFLRSRLRLTPCVFRQLLFLCS